MAQQSMLSLFNDDNALMAELATLEGAYSMGDQPPNSQVSDTRLLLVTVSQSGCPFLYILGRGVVMART